MIISNIVCNRNEKCAIRAGYFSITLCKQLIKRLTSDENISPMIIYGMGPQPIENMDM